MSRIDPARLSQVLFSLSKPKGELVAKHDRAPSTKASKKEQDIAQLRDSISQRLVKMRGRENFQAHAPIVTVQEILCWEFGSKILEHAEFERVLNDVVREMLADERARALFAEIINRLSGSDSN